MPTPFKPPSNPPVAKAVPSVTMPDTLYTEDRLTIVVPGLGAITVKPIVTVRLRLPDVPVMVTVDVTAAAVPLAASVRTLTPVALAGLNDAVTPLGSPDAARLTLPVKPFCGPPVIVVVPLLPCGIVKLAA